MQLLKICILLNILFFVLCVIILYTPSTVLQNNVSSYFCTYCIEYFLMDYCDPLIRDLLLRGIEKQQE